MAELVLGSVVDSITGQLVSLASQEIGLARGVKAELVKLQDTLAIIGGVLREAEKRQVQAEDVKEWLKKLKDVAYDADDLLDDFSTETLRRRRMMGRCKRMLNAVRIFFSSYNQLAYASKMAHRLIEIRERVDAISNDRVRFQLEGNSSLGSLVENRVRPETYPFESEPYVIGRDKDKKEVTDFLLNRNFEENVSILPIVGFGGLGKTTLARLVFNDESVKTYFELKLWVCVSNNFVVDDILRKILRECPLKEDLENLSINQVQKKLREELDGKKFLLVLDDVWNENRREWLKLQGYLAIGAQGSKILVTTRSPLVAKTMTTISHELGGLSDYESLYLLMRMAMKQEDEWKNQNLEIIAKDILKKCTGVPLAITTIGRLLLFTRNKEEDWLNFKNNDLSRINQEEGDIIPSLKLSYDFLPSHLKQCFAYCSLFPKDYELQPCELINLWMAQGFIESQSPGDRKTVEQVGQEHFMELLSRSFFQDIKEDQYGNIVRCKMHDLMHDLAMMVAKDNCITISGSHAERFPKGVRHISVVDFADRDLKGFDRDGRIRSLLFILENSDSIHISHLDVTCFKNLRALRLQSTGLMQRSNLTVVSGTISELKHLRALDLSGSNELRHLPNSISSLCNLETLNLRKCWRLKRLPGGITKLVKLRQLDVSGCSSLTHMPRGIGKLTNLQMLGAFSVGKKWKLNAARLSELSRLTALKKQLTIQNLARAGSISSEVDASFPLEKLALQSLKLCWGSWKARADSEEFLERLRPHPDLKRLKIDGYGGVRLSSWVSQLNKLVKIKINGCYWCRELPPLDQLPFLKEMSLSYLSNLECMALSESWTAQSSFPSLEVIVLGSLDQFHGWKRSRRGSRIEQAEDIQEDDSLSMFPAFSDKIKIEITGCPRFSYVHGRQHLQLGGITSRALQHLPRNNLHEAPLPVSTQSSTVMMISACSIPLAALTSLTICGIDDAQHLPVELFQSVPSLKSLVIKKCSQLKALSGKAILRYLPALQTLEISWCTELDLCIEYDDEDGGGEGVNNLQSHCKLSHVTIEGVHKTESLPGWLQYLSKLRYLKVEYCYGLKTLLRGQLLQWFLTTVEFLRLSFCDELDFTEEPEDQQDMPPNLQSAKLRLLEFSSMRRMTTLPWWIQYLSNLESLSIYFCNLKALPEWFPNLTSLNSLTIYRCGELSRRCKRDTGEDWPKISHIHQIRI